MPHFAFPEISPAIPEMVLTGLAMVLLLFGAFRG